MGGKGKDASPFKGGKGKGKRSTTGWDWGQQQGRPPAGEWRRNEDGSWWWDDQEPSWSTHHQDADDQLGICTVSGCKWPYVPPSQSPTGHGFCTNPACRRSYEKKLKTHEKRQDRTERARARR